MNCIKKVGICYSYICMFVSEVCKPVLGRMQKLIKITFQSDCRGATKMSTSRTLKHFLLTLLEK